MTKKTPPSPFEDLPTGELRAMLPPRSVIALDELEARLGNVGRGEATVKALLVGLFALGLDPAGDFCLAELTDAIYGKDSDDSTAVYNQIAEAGADAWTRWNMVQRADLAKVYAKPDAEVHA